MLDAVVVGAGLAGAKVAHDLIERGAKVRVLEARDRVGGRLCSVAAGGASFDLGGQWIAPHQARVSALAARLHLGTFPTHHRGEKVLSLGGERSTYRGTIPSIDPLGLVDLQIALVRLDNLRRNISLRRPSESVRAHRYDARTVRDWQRRNLRSDAAREVMTAAVRVVFGAEPEDLSFLGFLFYAQAGGGLMRLVEIDGGAQQLRFVGGAQGLVEKLCEPLGAALSVGTPVRAVEWSDAGVRVRAGGDMLEARRAVIAVPPPCLARIRFDPPLPPARQRLIARSPMGATTKHLLLYERPFWRERGLSGEVVWDRGPLCVAFDNCAANGAQPALLGFSVGDAARAWSARDPRDRQGAVRAQLAEALGDEAARPIVHLEKDWALERWTRGCPVALPTVATLCEVDRGMRAPTGAIHWAGTETAHEHHGFMEGALESAERVLRELG